MPPEKMAHRVNIDRTHVNSLGRCIYSASIDVIVQHHQLCILVSYQLKSPSPNMRDGGHLGRPDPGALFRHASRVGPLCDDKTGLMEKDRRLSRREHRRNVAVSYETKTASLVSRNETNVPILSALKSLKTLMVGDAGIEPATR